MKQNNKQNPKKSPWTRKIFETPFDRMLALNRQELMIFFARPIGPSNRVAWRSTISE